MKKYQDLSSFHQPDSFRGRSKYTVQIWWMVQATLFRCSPNVMYRWRNWLLRCFGAKIGKNVAIRSTAEFTYPWKVTIGDNCWVGHYCTFYSLGEIELGNDVALAHGVYLCTGSHDYTKPAFDIYASKITVKDEAWLANDVFVAPGVTIGQGAVIGSRSTVLADMPEGMVCVGYPAKPIKPRIPQ